MALFAKQPAAVWWAAAKRVFGQIDEKNLGLIAAGVAFYGILAVFPGIAALIALWGVLGDPGVIAAQLANFKAVLPQDVFDLLHGQITDLAIARNDTLGWAGIISMLLAIWSARAGVTAMMRGLNAIYGESNRSGLRAYLAALGLTVALIGVALVAVSCVVIAPVVLALVPWGWTTETLVSVLRWIIAIAVLIFGLGLVYRVGPNRRSARIGWISPGAIFAATSWTGASAAFSVYLANFGNYNEVYGSIGAVIALLMWLFLTAFLVLLGGALNAELERHTRADSTVGSTRPLGERGASVADTYIDA